MSIILCVYVCMVASLCFGEHCLDTQRCELCSSDTGDCITGCFDGFYGSKCDLRCRPNCKNNRCKLTSKGIEECTEGCNPGFYGTRCGLICHTPEEICEKCSGGCESGFCQLDSRCVSNCSESYFGRACKPCAGECDDCNKITGICQGCTNCLDRNCSEGCKEGCRPGYYGKNCKTKCSEHCLLGCHQESGHCKSCKVGWYGPLCDLRCSTGCLDSCIRDGSCVNGCLRGLYGEKCNRTCPSNCFDGHCQRDGSCHACIEGLFGRKCSKTCQFCDGVCDIDTGTCRKCKQYFTGSDCLFDCRLNCSQPRCDVYEFCIHHKDNGSSLIDYVPYISVGAMVFVVCILSLYVTLRLKRMNILIYGSTKNGQQHPYPDTKSVKTDVYVEAIDDPYFAIANLYDEVNEAEVIMYNQKSPPDIYKRESSQDSSANEPTHSFPVRKTGIGHDQEPAIYLRPCLDDRDAEVLNISSPGQAESPPIDSKSEHSEEDKNKAPNKLDSQYLTCVHVRQPLVLSTRSPN